MKEARQKCLDHCSRIHRSGSGGLQNTLGDRGARSLDFSTLGQAKSHVAQFQIVNDSAGGGAYVQSSHR